MITQKVYSTPYSSFTILITCTLHTAINHRATVVKIQSVSGYSMHCGKIVLKSMEVIAK